MISYVISYVLTVNGPDSDAPLHESAVNVRDERHRHCIRPHRKLCELKCNGSVRFTCIYPFSPRVSLHDFTISVIYDIIYDFIYKYMISYNDIIYIYIISYYDII